MSAKPSGRTAATPPSAAGSSRSTQRTGRTTTDYTDQEEEYKFDFFSKKDKKRRRFSSFRRLNAQLEAKTQALVHEAEQVLVSFSSLFKSIRFGFCLLLRTEKSKSFIDRK